MSETTTNARFARGERIRSLVAGLFGELLGAAAQDLSPNATFLELGADSLFLMRASLAVRERFGVRLPFRRLMEDLETVESLAAYLEREMPEEAAPPSVPGAGSIPPALEPRAAAATLPAAIVVPEPPMAGENGGSDRGAVVRMLSEQLRLMERQLDLLQRLRSPREGAARPAAVTAPAPAGAGPSPRRETFAPYVTPDRSRGGELTPQQRRALDELIRRVNERTGQSKEQAQRFRRVLANNRASAGFRLLWKELVYPLVGCRAEGARIWDADGHEYVDLTMGFGALLFGHSPPFLRRALGEQVERAIQIGPESDTAGRVAELISELTGAERVTFCNSGTEAVMIALRLARTVTGREKIALFSGSFHGTFDGVLAKGLRRPDGTLEGIPMAPGVPPHMIQPLILLDYESLDSLRVIEENGPDLAAVLVEPRQSRRPDLDRRDFLLKVREITERTDTALIFDEVVTGFRMHPGGIQALYGIRADITTYGKAVGNGLPIGVVAGKARYLDAVDGGQWRYGDDSLPEADTTFFAGTFFRHPLVMAGTLAVLEEIRRQGPGLQEELGRRTAALASELNGFFARQELPLKLEHFGSLFLLTYPPELRFMDLFFSYLLLAGVYVWERRVCYLSAAHDESALRRVVAAYKEAALAMRRAGFLPADPTAEETYPLTEAQRELWAVAQLGADASAAYNLSVQLDLRGHLDEEALTGALQTVIDRHPALRTTIDPLGEAQRVARRLELPLERSDLSTHPPGERSSTLQAITGAAARWCFDLAAGPLLRAQLIRLEQEHHVLLLTLHHVIADGQSLGVILDETAQLYAAKRRGEKALLAAPTPFRTWVEHLAAQERSGEMAQAEAFWLERLAAPLPVLAVPTDRLRPPAPGHRGDRRVLRLDAVAAGDIESLARRLSCTRFVLLLTAVQVLLHRLSGQEDLVVGVPATQESAGAGPRVGFCVCVLPLRTRPRRQQRFSAYLQEVRGTVLDAHEHLGPPLSRLARKLGLSGEPGRPGLVPVLFNLDRASRLDLQGLAAELTPAATGAVHFDLDWNVSWGDSSVEIECRFNAELFDPPTIESWLRCLEGLLAEVCRDPHLRLEELGGLISDPAGAEAAWSHGEEKGTGFRSVPARFAERAAELPDGVAVAQGDEYLTYGEIDGEVNRLARHLRRLGVGPETRVALRMERSPRLVTAILAVLKAGGAYVPVDPRSPRRRLADVWAECRPVVGLTEGLALPGEAGVDGGFPWLDLAQDGSWRQESRSEPGLAVSPQNLAYVLYTSGSTGRPKGVMVTHEGLANYLEWAMEAYEVARGTGSLLHSSPSFDLTVTSLFLPLLAGRTLRVIAGDDAGEGLAAALAAADDLSFVKLTPSHLEVLRQLLTPAAMRASRRWILGGEALSGARLEAWKSQAPACRVVNEYGPTETTVGCVVYETAAQDCPPEAVPVGRPIANTRVYLLDPALRPVLPHTPGELYIAGAGLARGYLERPELTAEVFLPDPFSSQPGARMYRSGDLVRAQHDGHLMYLGRLDHQVKLRGYRIEPGEIEVLLEGHGGVRQAAVVLRRNPAGEARLVAYVAADPRTAPRREELQDYLRARLPEPMIPSAFVQLEGMPMTPNGKVDRLALPAPEEPSPRPGRAYAPPVLPAEKTLACIWRQVLKRDDIGAHDNFFELDGDSIQAIQIVVRARREGLELSAQQFFRHPTIAELAELASADSGGGAESVPRAGAVPLTPIQRWFFGQRLARPQHWNLCRLFAISEPISRSALAAALRSLLAHQEVLSTRFPAGEDHALQGAPMGDGEGDLMWIDLAHLPAETWDAELARVASLLHGSLDLTRGPLLQAAFFDRGPAQAGLLLLVAHHLAVDLASWRLLSEDLTTAYRQAAAGDPVILPAKRSSFRTWAERLESHAQSPAMAAELAAWRLRLGEGGARLPVDAPGGVNTYGTVRRVSASLGSEETRRLLQDGPKILRARVSEVLLAALALTLQRWSGERAWLVDVEGNGREALFDDLDLSRTMGWFTAVYPVRLEAAPEMTPAEVLKGVKERLREIPQGGLTYGLVRYLSRVPGIAEEGRRLPGGEIVFNYRGEAGAAASTEDFLQAFEPPPAPAVDPRNARVYRLEIDAAVAGGRLEVHWRFSEGLHRRETIEGLARNCLQAVEELLAAGRQAEEAVLTAADFPRARVSNEDLGKLLGQLRRASRG